jgi:hypothetical protein
LDLIRISLIIVQPKAYPMRVIVSPAIFVVWCSLSSFVWAADAKPAVLNGQTVTQTLGGEDNSPYYTFSISGPSTLSGTIAQQGRATELQGLAVTLYKLDTTSGNYKQLGTDTTPASFSFASLGGGSYRLGLVNSNSKGDSSGEGKKYTLTASAAPVASAAPEATDLALTGLGLLGVGVWARRRQGR